MRINLHGQFLVLCCEVTTAMRIVISALLLALSGNKKDVKCSSGTELTDSYIPAGIQVLSHYLIQLHGPVSESSKTGREIKGTSTIPVAPTIIITYHTENTTEDTPETVKILKKLVSVLDAEAQEQGLGQCRGFTTKVLESLERSSKSTAIVQLLFILEGIRDGEIMKEPTRLLVKATLTELNNQESVLRKALENVYPLKYLSDFSLE